MNNFNDVDTYLEHFGKKGMRWGVRKGPQEGSGGGKAPKPTTAQIKEARRNQAIRAAEATVKLAKTTDQTTASRSTLAARAKGNTADVRKIKEARKDIAVKKLKAEATLAKHADAKIAATKTKSEKWAGRVDNALLATWGAAVILGAAANAANAASK